MRIVAPSLPEDTNVARCGRQQTFENFYCRCLPCSVGTEQAKALAGFDLKADSANGLDFAVVGLAQVVTLDRNFCRHGHGAFYRSGREQQSPVSKRLRGLTLFLLARVQSLLSYRQR